MLILSLLKSAPMSRQQQLVSNCMRKLLTIAAGVYETKPSSHNHSNQKDQRHISSAFQNPSKVKGHRNVIEKELGPDSISSFLLFPDDDTIHKSAYSPLYHTDPRHKPNGYDTMHAVGSRHNAAIIHSFNVIRCVIRDETISQHCSSAIAQSYGLALQGFLSPSYAIRNAGMMLFSALQIRLFGSAEIASAAAEGRHIFRAGGGRVTSLLSVFSDFPGLDDVILRAIRVTADLSDITTSSNAYLALLFLSSLDNRNTVPSGDRTSTDAQLALGIIDTLLEKWACHRDIRIRSLTARALSAITPSTLAKHVCEKICCAVSVHLHLAEKSHDHCTNETCDVENKHVDDPNIPSTLCHSQHFVRVSSLISSNFLHGMLLSLSQLIRTHENNLDPCRLCFYCDMWWDAFCNIAHVSCRIGKGIRKSTVSGNDQDLAHDISAIDNLCPAIFSEYWLCVSGCLRCVIGSNRHDKEVSDVFKIKAGDKSTIEKGIHLVKRAEANIMHKLEHCDPSMCTKPGHIALMESLGCVAMTGRALILSSHSIAQYFLPFTGAAPDVSVNEKTGGVALNFVEPIPFSMLMHNDDVARGALQATSKLLNYDVLNPQLICAIVDILSDWDRQHHVSSMFFQSNSIDTILEMLRYIQDYVFYPKTSDCTLDIMIACVSVCHSLVHSTFDAIRKEATITCGYVVRYLLLLDATSLTVVGEYIQCINSLSDGIVDSTIAMAVACACETLPDIIKAFSGKIDTAQISSVQQLIPGFLDTVGTVMLLLFHDDVAVSSKCSQIVLEMGKIVQPKIMFANSLHSFAPLVATIHLVRICECVFSELVDSCYTRNYIAEFLFRQVQKELSQMSETLSRNHLASKSYMKDPICMNAQDKMDGFDDTSRYGEAFPLFPYLDVIEMIHYRQETNGQFLDCLSGQHSPASLKSIFNQFKADRIVHAATSSSITIQRFRSKSSQLDLEHFDLMKDIPMKEARLHCNGGRVLQLAVGSLLLLSRLDFSQAK